MKDRYLVEVVTDKGRETVVCHVIAQKGKESIVRTYAGVYTVDTNSLIIPKNK